MDPRTLLGAAAAAGTSASTGASPGAASTSSPAPTGGILSLLQRRPPVPVGSAPPAGALGPPTVSDRDLQLPDLGENVTVANPFITCCVNDNALLVSGPFISGAEVSVTLESGGRKLKITFTKRPFTFDPNVLDLSDEDRKKAEEKNPYTILQSGALATVRGGAVIPTWTYCASIDTPLGVTAYPRSAGETLKEVSRAGWTFFFNTSPPTMTQTISQPTESPPKKSRTSSRLSTAVPETPAKDTNQ